MNYKEAYEKLIKKYPDMWAGGCTIYKDLYIFQLTPKEIAKWKDFTPEEIADESYSVHKMTGEINRFSPLDPLNMYAILNGKNVVFNNEDELKETA